MKKIILFILPLLFSGCGLFKSSKEIDLIPFVQKDKYGYFDLEGKIIINPQFAFATAFREDLALVKTSGKDPKWGFIDKEGKFIINPTYKDATVFQEGLAWVVTENGAPTAIDKKGEIKFTLKEADKVLLFNEELAAFSIADTTSVKWGFVDKSGKKVINPQFNDVGYFSDGKCPVKNKDGKWGFIDKEGKIVINYQFDQVDNFTNDKAVVYVDEKAGIIDQDGKYIVNPQFQYAYIDDDKYLIYQDDKAGWCDEDGKFIINPQFNNAERFNDDDLACIKSSDTYGYIDSKGKIMINPQFEEASQFIGDVAIVKSGDKYGLIDKEGKYVVNPQFEDIGADVYYYLADFSVKNSISSDYLDIDKILKPININEPENLSLDDDFQTILNKTNKTISDFSAYSDNHLIFEDKTITKDVTYGFAIMGNLKDLNPYTYEYYITNEKPTGFIYGFKLSGKATGKAESIQKAFEKKLSNYNLMKKGYINNAYASVYRNDKNIIITYNTGSSIPLIYILKKDFEVSTFIDTITDKPNEPKNNIDDEYEEAAIDSVAMPYDYE